MDNLANIAVEQLTSLSLKELLNLQSNISKAIDIRKETNKIEFLNKITSLAAETGFSLDELLSEKKIGAKGKPERSAPKYRNPQNPKQTWPGHGRKPHWLLDQVSEGKELDYFLI